MKRYDFFTFLNGFDILKLRLAELADHVDWFVLVEGTHNYRGKEKPLYFKENPITGYKIKHVIVETKWQGDHGINNEWSQDNISHMVEEGFREGAQGANASDLGYFSDFDEIPRPSKLTEGPLDQCVLFEMDWYLYFLNCKADMKIGGTSRAQLGSVDSFWSALSLRYAAAEKYVIENGGWHFSSFGGVDTVMDKLAGFPNEDYRNLKREEVLSDMLAGRDLHNGALGRRRMGIGPLDKTLPKPILDHPEQWKHLMHPEWR